MSEPNPVATLNAQGMLCPMPVIKVQERIADLRPGTVLAVLATDPGALADVPAWCRVHGHEVIESVQDGREIRIRIKVN